MATLSKSIVDSERVVLPRPSGTPRLLSSGQLGLWYLSQLSSTAYNVPFYDRLKGPLNIDVLEMALNEVVGRHEVLRTIIPSPGGKPIPIRLNKWCLKMKRIDLRALPRNERENAARRVLVEESSQPFNLSRDILLRATVIQFDDDEFIFLHDVPHLAFDGNSIPIFLHEVAAFYNGKLRGTPVLLPELTVQYADFAYWQKNFLQGERIERLICYWGEQLKECPIVDLPGQLPRPKVHSMRGGRKYFVLPKDLLKQASEFFRSAGTTPYRGLCATFLVFLFAYTDQGDLAVGSPFGPRCAGIENLIGFFVNTVVLRVRLVDSESFRGVIAKLDAVVKDAIQHSEITFDKLMDAAKPKRDPGRHPLFQVNFRAPKQPYPFLELDGIQAERTTYVDNNTSKFDLALEIETSLGENCYFEYYADLFTREAVDQMVQDFIDLLRSLVSDPQVPITRVPALIAIRQRNKAAKCDAGHI